MNKVQRSWADISKELNDQLSRYTLTNRALATASGADYYAIRRFRRNGAHNQTDNAEKLCSFFNIEINCNKNAQSNVLGKLVSELEAVWDGSDSHAHLLTKLIRSTRSFRVEERSKS